MTRIHDMGGRIGDGKVSTEFSDIKFKHKWEEEVFALTIALGFSGLWNLDSSRFARESLEPADYLSFSYFEKWLAALINLLNENGVISELKDNNDQSFEKEFRKLEAHNVKTALGKGGPTRRKETRLKSFEVGELVKIKNFHGNEKVCGGHTRLPNYVKGRTGKIIDYHGFHVFPDTNAHYLGENPEPLYSIEFTSQELWGKHSTHSGDKVVVDIWESYICEENCA